MEIKSFSKDGVTIELSVYGDEYWVNSINRNTSLSGGVGYTDKEEAENMYAWKVERLTKSEQTKSRP